MAVIYSLLWILLLVPDAAALQKNIVHMGDVEELILTMTNEIRQQHGLERLRGESTLRDIARRHSDDMIVRRFFAHKNPDGDSAEERIASQHRRLIGGVGENIWRYASTLETDGRRDPAYIRMTPRKMAETAINGWMESPGHRENILRPQFTHLGVGVSIIKGEVVATQNFAAVRAYINMTLPQRVGTGGLLNMKTISYPSSEPEAERYDYWIEAQDKPAIDPQIISNGRVSVQSGVYRVRFYFPIADGYMIYMGPQIEVR